jgi:glycosyltransferase involved in cell wall biosynthesis
MTLRFLAGGVFSLAVLWQLMRRRRYELVLVVTNPPANALAAWIYSKLRRVPYVYCVNDLYPDIAVALGRLCGSSLITRCFHSIQRMWLRSAARIVVVGRCMREHIHREYGVSLQSISIIRNWADPAQIRPSPKENTFRKMNELTGFVVLYGGNFSHYVNFSQILGAAKILTANDSVSFVLIGDGVRKNEILDYVRKEELKKVKVIPAVPRTAMGEVMAASDVSIISLDPRMLGLGTPGKLYSILASGRPIIGMVPSAGEVALILKEEDCGINVADGDAAALAREILRLQGDSELAGRMGRNARRALEQRFTLQHAVEGFHTLFGEILGNG